MMISIMCFILNPAVQKNTDYLSSINAKFIQAYLHGASACVSESEQSAQSWQADLRMKHGSHFDTENIVYD